MLQSDNPGLVAFYGERQEFYLKTLEQRERDVLKEVDALLWQASDVIGDPSPDNVITFQGKLASILCSLGEITAQAETEWGVTKDYIDECFADEFTSSKEILEATKARVLKAEIETSISKRHRDTFHLSRLLEARFKAYKAKLQSGDRLIDALQNRIIQFRREQERANL